jgi:hypothetical protein
MMNLPMPEYGTNDKETINNLMDTVMKLRKELEFVLHHLDDENIPSLAGIKGDIKNNYTKIEQTDSAIVLMAADVSGNKAAIELNSNSINLKANQSAVDNLTGRVVSAESSIDINASGISSKVSKTDYTGNTITSLINQSATTVDIEASKINLNGITTMSGLARVSDVLQLGLSSQDGKVRFGSGVEIFTGGLYSNDDLVLDAPSGAVHVTGNMYISDELIISDTLQVDRIYTSSQSATHKIYGSRAKFYCPVEFDGLEIKYDEDHDDLMFYYDGDLIKTI